MFIFLVALLLVALEWLLGMCVVFVVAQCAFWMHVPTPEWIFIWGGIGWTLFVLWNVARGLRNALRSG